MNFETVEVSTNAGFIDVPAFKLEDHQGLAITMKSFGSFDITHTKSGLRVVNGSYERFDHALLDMARLLLIAAIYKFSWSEDDPAKKFMEIWENPVPFDGATSTRNGETVPMTIKDWKQLLVPFPTLSHIDSQPWEERCPLNQADDLLGEVKTTLEAD